MQSSIYPCKSRSIIVGAGCGCGCGCGCTGCLGCGCGFVATTVVVEGSGGRLGDNDGVFDVDISLILKI
jgi:hypothetical protein